MNQDEANLAAAIMLIDQTIRRRTVTTIVALIDEVVDNRACGCNPDSDSCEVCQALLNVASLIYGLGELDDPNELLS